MNNARLTQRSIMSQVALIINKDYTELYNYKLSLIKDIMNYRLFMGYDNTGILFDKLYEHDIDVLELLEMEYHEQALRFAERNKHV